MLCMLRVSQWPPKFVEEKHLTLKHQEEIMLNSEPDLRDVLKIEITRFLLGVIFLIHKTVLAL